MNKHRILITGGAGFIGVNLAHRLIGQGHDVGIFDNLSRSGCVANLEWLRADYGPQAFTLNSDDIANYDSLCRAMEGVDRVYHLAGQVAVTTSMKDPRADFFANAQGTVNALEAARLSGSDPIFIYASTNKVYGKMEGVAVEELATRYCYRDLPFGISEDQPLDFHSPYGCSKGAGDQYVRDYSRVFGLRAVVARQSCIYGYRQFGIEDQGWLAWFMIAALKGIPISIFGDGKQVRDVLFVDDLLDAYERAVDTIEVSAGQIYNIGGGPQNTVSIWTEFGPLLERLIGHEVPVVHQSWRQGDQPVYVSDIRKADEDLQWRPQVSVNHGLERLFEWISTHPELFSHLGK